MKYQKLHFAFEECKEPNATFGKRLIRELGQATPEEAEAFIRIGGDGWLLQGLREANGKPVLGITPPGTNSRGFWMERGIDDAQKLIDALEAAEIVELKPIEANIHFANGNSAVRYAFNCVSAEKTSGQAMLMDLEVELGKSRLKLDRMMGNGMTFSTALGSTGLNRSCGGPAVDIHDDALIVTGVNLCNPRGAASVVTRPDARVRVAFTSATYKRPVRVDYDGLSIDEDADGSPIVSLSIRTAPEKSAKFLVVSEPGIKAFSVMMRQT